MKPKTEQQLRAISRHFRPLLQDGTRPVEFIGRIAAEVPDLLRHGMRGRDFRYYLDLCGVQALPIVLLICLLMGMVMAINGQIQLSKFGQELLVADAVGLVVVKELGPLMVALVMTGWAGSAFAAEIGTMKLDEQICALETMGIRPESFLVFPKLSAMLLSMPLLTIFGNVAGILGGMLVGITIMKITPVAYWTRTLEAINITTFVLGVLKSFPFAILVTFAGCFCGFNAANNSQGVGRGATKAVVSSIFLIVVADVIITVLYSFIGY
ncbi:MAG: ABC transporter permease [Victivallales bacterium]|nr:ABC transporter permease [Victivallales bacterium]